jgi:hypothetical protein
MGCTKYDKHNNALMLTFGDLTIEIGSPIS